MEHALAGMTRTEAQQVVSILVQIDFATEMAELAGTSVVVPADEMRAVLVYVEKLVQFYNENTVPPLPRVSPPFTEEEARHAMTGE